jgi:ParB family chromosome partitioning protein
MTRLSLSQAQLAEKVGKDRATVANALRLLKLPENVQTLLQDGDLSMGQARALLGLKKKSQIDKVVATIMARGLNVRQVEALVKQINESGDEPAASEKPQISPFIAAVATQLEEKFGTKVKVNTATKGNGKIEINYVSNDDLSRILALLNIEVD